MTPRSPLVLVLVLALVVLGACSSAARPSAHAHPTTTTTSATVTPTTRARPAPVACAAVVTPSPVPAIIPPAGVGVARAMTLSPPRSGDRSRVTRAEALIVARRYGNPDFGRFSVVVLARYTDFDHGAGLTDRLAWIVVQTYSHPADVGVGGLAPRTGPVCASYHLIVLDAFDGHLLKGYEA